MAKSKLRKNRNKVLSKNTETRCERKLAVLKRNKKANEINKLDIPQDIKDLLIAPVYKLEIPEEKYEEIKRNNPDYFDWEGNMILPDLEEKKEDNFGGLIEQIENIEEVTYKPLTKEIITDFFEKQNKVEFNSKRIKKI